MRAKITAHEVSAAWVMVRMALALAVLLVIALAVVRPRLTFVTEGRPLPVAVLAHGVLLTENTPADLAGARATARRFVSHRFAYVPATLNAGLAQAMAEASPAGRRVMASSIPRQALAQLILGDSGHAQLREFADGAYAYGEASGRVHVVVPLEGRYWSRHVPFTGARSGIPLGATIDVWLRRVDGAWRVDSVAGELLPEGLLALWQRYRVAERPVPRLVIRGVIASGDTAQRAAWQRGLWYPDQD